MAKNCVTLEIANQPSKPSSSTSNIKVAFGGIVEMVKEKNQTILLVKLKVTKLWLFSSWKTHYSSETHNLAEMH